MTTNRYGNGKIYKLVNDVDDEIYVGSTCLSLSKRLHYHRNAKTTRSQIKIYSHLNNIGWERVKIVLIEECPCENKEQLLRRERYWIENLKATLNTHMPSRTYKQYYEEHKTVIIEHARMYYQQNKERYHQQSKQRWQNTKEIQQQKSKEWREKNRDTLRQKKQEYYQNHRDDILEKLKEKVKCECGCEIVKCHVNRHNKTKKHQQWLSNQPSTS
jgi:hypothetical protein